MSDNEGTPIAWVNYDDEGDWRRLYVRQPGSGYWCIWRDGRIAPVLTRTADAVPLVPATQVRDMRRRIERETEENGLLNAEITELHATIEGLKEFQDRVMAGLRAIPADVEKRFVYDLQNANLDWGKLLTHLADDRDYWSAECEKSRRRERELMAERDADIAAAPQLPALDTPEALRYAADVVAKNFSRLRSGDTPIAALLLERAKRVEANACADAEREARIEKLATALSTSDPDHMNGGWDDRPSGFIIAATSLDDLGYRLDPTQAKATS